MEHSSRREDWMALALELARRAQGRTSPNPPVGAVVVRDGEVVGQGWTQPPGGPHAEVVALNEARDRARGATLYVTLEPCTFYGRTPPCTDAIQAAGITRVIFAARDPDPRIGAGAAAALAPHGITVEQDLASAEQAEQLYAAFSRWVRDRRPFVTVKYAMTLDGKIAARSGDARWITGPAARRFVHELRDCSDAILVGIGTVETDDPLLTVRLEQHWRELQHPLRIVVDSRGRMQLQARMLAPETPGRTLVATTAAAPAGWRAALAERGVEVLELPALESGRVDLGTLLTELGRRGIVSLLVEGGSEIIASLLAARLVDRVLAFVAPKIIGGVDAPTPVGGSGAERMGDAIPFRICRIEHIGDDVLIVADPAWYNRGD